MKQNALYENHGIVGFKNQQGRKRPLDMSKRMIERRARERKVKGEI